MSIGNDSLTIGTAAVAAGTANLVVQKKDAINQVLVPTKDAFVSTAKSSITAKPYKKAGQAIVNTCASIKNNILGLFKKSKNHAPKLAQPVEFPVVINGEQFNNIRELRAKYTDLNRLMRAENIMQNARAQKEALLAKNSAFASPEAEAYFKAHGQYLNLNDKISNAGKKILNSVKSVNWKTVGIYAGIAAVVATAVVVAKNVLFPSKDKA